MNGRIRRLYDFELEPEVGGWLDSLSDSDFKRVDEVCGMLAEKGTELGGPVVRSPGGTGLGAADPAARCCGQDHVLVYCKGTIVLLTLFRKTKQHDQRQIDRAVRAQKACERDHRGPAVETYERQV